MSIGTYLGTIIFFIGQDPTNVCQEGSEITNSLNGMQPQPKATSP